MDLRRAVAKVVAGAGTVLLPPLCPLCQGAAPADPAAFCRGCLEGLLPLAEPFCPHCGVPYRGAGPCHPCPQCSATPPPFEALRSWGVYEGALLAAVRSFKFGGRFTLRRALESLLVDAFDRFLGARADSLRAVVPVPCHRSTLRRRGFDLPALLSRRLSRERALPWRPRALVKTADAPELVGLSAQERARTAARIYSPREELDGAVLLVDDVVTTTATARACARACLRAGAREVWVLALARTPLQTR